MSRVLWITTWTLWGWHVIVAWNVALYTYRYWRHYRQISHSYFWPWPYRTYEPATNGFVTEIALGPVRLTRVGSWRSVEVEEDAQAGLL